LITVHFRTTYIILSAVLLAACNDDNGVSQSSSVPETEATEVLYLNALDIHDALRLSSYLDGQDDPAKMKLYRSGTDIVDVVDRCSIGNAEICFDFGNYFRLKLPCNEDAIKGHWNDGEWSFEIISILGTQAAEYSYLIEVRPNIGDVPTRVLYSYASGVKMFFYQGVDVVLEGDSSFELPMTNVIYVANGAEYGAAHMYCIQGN